MTTGPLGAYEPFARAEAPGLRVLLQDDDPLVRPRLRLPAGLVPGGGGHIGWHTAHGSGESQLAGR